MEASPERPFRRIAHRGASGHRPENTRAAFLHALELGARMIEFDCQLTRDGKVVVFHDEVLERTTSGQGRLADFGLAELKRLDAGAWFSPEFAGERIPTLEETAKLVGRKAELNVELKGEDPVGRIELLAAGVIADQGLLDSTVFSAFAPERLAGLRRLSPWPRLAVLPDDGASWDEAFHWAAALRAEAVHAPDSMVTPEAVELAHRRGFEVRVWLVNDPPRIAELVGFGVDGIFTSYPERLLGVPGAGSERYGTS